MYTDISKKTKSLLDQIKGFVNEESTDMLFFEDAHDLNNWEGFKAQKTLDDSLAESLKAGLIKREGDFYKVLGMTQEKLSDAGSLLGYLDD